MTKTRQLLQYKIDTYNDHLAKFKDGLDYSDWIPDIQAESLSISFDRKGIRSWEKNYFEYNNHKMRAVEVVTR